MLIKSVHIKKFRAFNDVQINLAPSITVISGQNGTLKTTLLGILGQPFSLNNGPLKNAKTIDGKKFCTNFNENFQMSPVFDKVGEHLVKLFLVEGLYKDNEIEYNSIPRNEKRKTGIRIWPTKGARQRGSGYAHAPVLYLSLRRLTPLGEIKSKSCSFELTGDEIKFFKKWHAKILTPGEPITSVVGIQGDLKKSTLAPETEYYDSSTISAGQDNVGKIILSVLSFRRLQENFPQDYRGGLLLIDELDSTLFPSAQTKIFEFLAFAASKFNIQVVFTTHSTTILRETKKYNKNPNVSIVYLKKLERQICVYENAALEQIENDLRIEATSQKTKVEVFAEDEVAINFISQLLRKYKAYIILQEKCTLGAAEYERLIKNVEHFKRSVVILDGDQKKIITKLKAENVFCLPGESCFPEDMFYRFLRELPESDQFWSKNLGEYTRQICFKNFPPEEYDDILQDNVRRDKTKEWFQDNRQHWKTRESYLFQRWIQANPNEAQEFVEKFKVAYQKLTNLTIPE